MTVEPISDADLAAICAALDGLPETSERPYRGMIARIHRDAAEIAELRRVKDGMAIEMVEASDHLASVLGYPLDPDENGVPTGPHYCVGDHTIATLAAEAGQEIAALKARQAWMPIETARDAGHRRFLCWDRHYGLRIGTVHVRTDHDDWLSYMDGFGGSSKGGMRATHWRPLPTPPEDPAHG